MNTNARIRKLFLKLFLLLIIVVAGAVSWYKANLAAVDAESKEQKIFVVARGQTTDKILGKLKDDGLIRSELAVKTYLYFNNDYGNIQAGTFKLSPAMTAEQLVNVLKNGAFDVWVTIPEGWRGEQIVDELMDNGLMDLSKKTEAYEQFRKDEGRLFPDTYLFAKDSGSEIMKRKMLDNFEVKTEGLDITDQGLVLASLIEREAKHDSDRSMISGVINNRLKIGMPLQIDATLQYVMDNRRPIGAQWWQTVAVADKKVESPFNTYLNKGLPPTPICNPGLLSIKAALNPSESDYLYYLSEDDGTTHYAKTMAEHQENIRKYLK